MPTKGGRTAHRVSSRLFSQSQIQSKIPNQIPANIICTNLCKVFCDYRQTILDEMQKSRPDMANNVFREALTDIGTCSDFLYGGQCECDCKKR